jgi:hypothetical protein
MLRTALSIVFAASTFMLDSSAGAGVVICGDDDDVRNWTIALGSSIQQARGNAVEIIGQECAKKVQCDGGWYARVSSSSTGGAGFACGQPNLAAAYAVALKLCRETTSGCDQCISGFDDKKSAQAKSGTAWMGNSYTSRSCPR